MMNSKPLLAVVLLFFLVDHVHMICNRKFENPSIREEFIACSRKHTPRVVWNYMLDCVPMCSDLETVLVESFRYGRNSPQSYDFLRCLEGKYRVHQAELTVWNSIQGCAPVAMDMETMLIDPRRYLKRSAQSYDFLEVDRTIVKRPFHGCPANIPDPFDDFGCF